MYHVTAADMGSIHRHQLSFHEAQVCLYCLRMLLTIAICLLLMFCFKNAAEHRFFENEECTLTQISTLGFEMKQGL